MKANFDDLWTLKFGDTVVIRRTSGAEQVATVNSVRSGIEYVAPEIVSFSVTFEENGKTMVKGCNAFDLIRRA